MSKENMIKLFNDFDKKYDINTVFSDFLEINAIAISNSVDKTDFDKKEERYKQIVKNYTKDEVKVFARIFAELVLELEDNPSDVLGDLFFKFKLNDSKKGQVFTPLHIAKMMAAFTLKDAKKNIEEKGYVSLLEPSCGSGVNVIGCALYLKDIGINYQNHLFVEATDIDLRCTLMTYIQLSLLGVPALVYHGDTLKQEKYSCWKTPFYCLHGLFEKTS